jgi:hypothetical protein
MVNVSSGNQCVACETRQCQTQECCCLENIQYLAPSARNDGVKAMSSLVLESDKSANVILCILHLGDCNGHEQSRLPQCFELAVDVFLRCSRARASLCIQYDAVKAIYVGHLDI